MILTKIKRSNFLIIFSVIVVVLFFSFEVKAASVPCSITAFYGGSAYKTLNFPPGGGHNYDAKVSLPMGATISAVTVDVVPFGTTGTPYIWVPLTASNQLVQIKTSDGSFVSKFKQNSNTQDCTAGCLTDNPTWTDRSPATTCSVNAFNNPSRITLIPGGDVWVADRVGSYVTRLGGKNGCAGDNCYECKGSYLVGSNPKGVTIDTDGNVWVGDNGDNKIWKFNSDGTYAWPSPYYVDIGHSTYGMMADQKGNIWISSGGVAKINKNNCTQTSCPVTVVSGGTFDITGGAYGLGIDNDGDVWIGNWEGNSVDEIDGASATGKTDCTTGFSGCCTGTAIDGKNNVWTSGHSSNSIYVMVNGNCGNVKTLNSVCTDATGPAGPHGIAIDSDNNGWIICRHGEVIKYKFDGVNFELLKRISLNGTTGAGGGYDAAYNYSDMTGFRSVPTSLNIGATEFYPSSGTTYTSFGPALKSALQNCSCFDEKGVQHCEEDAVETGYCIVPLSLFSISGGSYKAEKLSITCSQNMPDTSTGLVPCGRMSDNGATPLIDESQPCTLCAMFYLLKNVINFIITLSVGIGVFILVLAGLLYASSAGNSHKIELAKSAVTSVLIGLAIVFVAWLVIAVILQGMGYASISTWYQVDCTL